ncbi:DMT family transporter [Telluria aromaticivorans]|uniref:DMT family transporter n=1 Tax=Telluria aromaticivorans TaxID=2725995 RepID=A0A7Y2K315_9BURK|nr:DMT family transporter [Telluria aromaticivorans]NNG25403.1 DMT family transporter [Telluria aromaticivorans]
MALAVFMFALMDTVMKLLTARYPAIQVAALRSLTSLPLVAIYVGVRVGYRDIFKVRWPLHLLRGVLGIAMLTFFAFGIRNLSLAEAYTIFFVSPALITALSVWFLKERVGAARWIAIVVGLGGVLVVLRPTGAGFLTIGGLAILGAAAMYAVSAITVGILARTDRNEHMVFWLMVMVAVGASALAAPGWVALSMADLPLLAALSFTGFIGQLAITEAFAKGEASSIAPFEYTALAWAVGLDWLLWQTLPDGYTMIGAAIIIGSGLYLLRHEKDHVEAEHP